MKTILILGGAGYIGSHMCKLLKKSGYTTIVLDNFSTSLPQTQYADNVYNGRMGDEALLHRIFHQNPIDAVMHFAGHSQIHESHCHPLKYYLTNVAETIQFLAICQSYAINKLIFSSSCAVYGVPQYIPIDELHPTTPCSPYGQSKLMIETILADLGNLSDFKSIVLRYFNVAGCDPEGVLQELHEPETHLLPRIISAITDTQNEIPIFGTDYNTLDGTCIRDYIHVTDLCYAHLLALEKLLQHPYSAIYNLGQRRGYSVLELVRSVEELTQKIAQIKPCPPRRGDPPILIANATRAQTELGWQPHYDLVDMILHSLQHTTYGVYERC